MLKIAVVGIGGISGAHIPAWISMKEVELVALCDVRLSQLEKYTDFRTYRDFDEMLEKEKIDLLDICLPTFLHVEYSLKAMNKGINVLCEKPVSLDKADVQKLYECAKINNVKFMVAHVIRFWPEYEMIKELNDSGKYGKMLSGKMTRISQIPGWSWDGWMTDEKRSGLVPFDLHIHDLDFLIYAFGKPKNVKSSRIKRPEQDSFSVIYDFDGAFVCCESAWYAAPLPFESNFRFQFEKALVVYEKGKTIIYEVDGDVLNVNSDGKEELRAINLPKTDAYANEIKYFADCVINNKEVEKIKPDELECVIDILNNL